MTKLIGVYLVEVVANQNFPITALFRYSSRKRNVQEMRSRRCDGAFTRRDVRDRDVGGTGGVSIQYENG